MPFTVRFEQHRVVGRPQGVGDMVQIDLELADTIFGNGRVDGNALRPAGFVDVVDEEFEIVDLVDRQRRIGIETAPGDR